MDGYQVKDNYYYAGLEYPSYTKSSLGSWKVFEEAMPRCRITPRLVVYRGFPGSSAVKNLLAKQET